MDNLIEFRKAKGFEEENIKLPVRSTEDSNGYDFFSNEDLVVPSYSRSLIEGKAIKPVLVSTGITAIFPKTVALLILDRSSNPIKRGLSLANSVGDIDSGYYPLEIKGMFYNFSNMDYKIHKGDRIMQGLFIPFLVTSNDEANGYRNGGFGSTGI